MEKKKGITTTHNMTTEFIALYETAWQNIIS